MQVRTLVGQHDTGLFDKSDAVRTTKTLGRDVDAAEAIKLTQENKGAEMLIEKQGADGSKKYDVYALAVDGNEGKSLKSVDLFEHVSLEKDLAKKFGGTQAIIAPENEKWDKPDKDFISYLNVRPDLGQGLEGLKYAAFAAKVNTLSFLSTGKGAVPPTMGQVYANEHIQFDAERAAARPPEVLHEATHAISAAEPAKPIPSNMFPPMPLPNALEYHPPMFDSHEYRPPMPVIYPAAPWLFPSMVTEPGKP